MSWPRRRVGVCAWLRRTGALSDGACRAVRLVPCRPRPSRRESVAGGGVREAPPLLLSERSRCGGLCRAACGARGRAPAPAFGCLRSWPQPQTGLGGGALSLGRADTFRRAASLLPRPSAPGCSMCRHARARGQLCASDNRSAVARSSANVPPFASGIRRSDAVVCRQCCECGSRPVGAARRSARTAPQARLRNGHVRWYPASVNTRSTVPGRRSGPVWTSPAARPRACQRGNPRPTPHPPAHADVTPQSSTARPASPLRPGYVPRAAPTPAVPLLRGPPAALPHRPRHPTRTSHHSRRLAPSPQLPAPTGDGHLLRCCARSLAPAGLLVPDAERQDDRAPCGGRAPREPVATVAPWHRGTAPRNTPVPALPIGPRPEPRGSDLVVTRAGRPPCRRRRREDYIGPRAGSF